MPIKKPKYAKPTGATSSKKLMSLLEDNTTASQSKNTQLINSNTKLSGQISQLTNFLIRDRILRDLETNQERSDITRVRGERAKIRQKIQKLGQKDTTKTLQNEIGEKSSNDVPAEPDSTQNFISAGLFAELLKKEDKKKNKAETPKDDSSEPKESEDTSDDASKNSSKTRKPKQSTAGAKPTIPTPTFIKDAQGEMAEARPDSFYRDRDDADKVDKKKSLVDSRIIDIDPKAIRILEGIFNKLRSPGSNSSGLFDTGLSRQRKSTSGGLFSKGARLAGRAALPATVAYGIYNFMSGMTDASVRKNIERKIEKISDSDRVKSGLGEMFSQLSFGLLGDSVSVTRFIDSSIGKFVTKMEPFLGDASPIKILQEYLAYGTLESALKKLEETLLSFWNPREKPEDLTKNLPPFSEAGIRKVPPTPISVSEVIEQKFTDKDLANSIKKFVMSESSGRKSIINDIGAAGLYQFIQSTALEQARKTGREDIIAALKDKSIVDFTKDKTIQVLKEQRKFSEIPEYIKTTYPQSVATAVANLSAEQQTAMFEQFIDPLLKHNKSPDFADIKAFGFAPKYLRALTENNMDMPIYQKTDKSNPFLHNKDFAIWDRDKNGILTAKELVEGIRGAFDDSKTKTTDKDDSTKPTPIAATNGQMKPLLRFMSPDLSTVTENDRKEKRLQPGISRLWDEIDKEFKSEMATGKPQKNENGQILFPIERLRIRHLYESITGESSSTPGLSYDVLKKEMEVKKPQASLVPSNEPVRKSGIVNNNEVLQEKRLLEAAASHQTIINSPSTTNIVASSGQKETYTENRERVKDVFNPYSRALDRLWGVAG